MTTDPNDEIVRRRTEQVLWLAAAIVTEGLLRQATVEVDAAERYLASRRRHAATEVSK